MTGQFTNQKHQIARMSRCIGSVEQRYAAGIADTQLHKRTAWGCRGCGRIYAVA